MLFHLTTRTEWDRARAAGEHAPASLAREWFIHLSTEAQWPGVRGRFYATTPDLLLLVIDPSQLRHEVRYELADGDRYPHLYGALDVAAVVEVREP